MLLSAFKKKSEPLSELSEEESTRFTVVEHWDEESEQSVPLFCVPRTLSDSFKIFNPE